MLSSGGEKLTAMGYKERVIYALVFLFPIAGVSVGHWFSAMFVILVLMSLWELPRNRRSSSLSKSEDIWLACCVGFLGSFLISALANGWDDGQAKSLGVDIRFLLVVPLYLMLQRFPKAGRYLLMGCAIAAITLAAQSVYDKLILGLPRAEGCYSPNLLGPVAALVAVWLVVGREFLPRLKWILPFLVMGAVYAVVMSGSRGGYLGLLAMVIVCVIVISKGYQRLIALCMVGLIVVGGYFGSAMVKERVDTAVHEAVGYWTAENRDELPLGSISWRFEIWTVATKAFLESPIVGVGSRHYDIYSKKYADLGEINPAAVSDGHAHSAYFEVLMSRGILGLIFFAGVLFYPLYIFASTYRASPATALLGISLVVGYAAFSLTDHSTFNMGNFASIFLLCMSLFLIWHLDLIKQEES